MRTYFLECDERGININMSIMSGPSRFIQQRQQCLITCLEATGARVGELAKLRVNDILDAFKMGLPMLKISTLKREKGAFRLIPVAKMFIAELKSHINIQRQAVIKKHFGSKKDHGFFFVSETTGMPLLSTTLSEEIYRIRAVAGIEEEACAHMFRHAFITNLIILLIKRYHIENEDSFRFMLLTDSTLKIELMQWTGHKNEASLRCIY